MASPELIERLRAVAHERGDDPRAVAALRSIVGGGVSGGGVSNDETAFDERPFGIPAVDAMLAEAGGLPRRGVVELAAPEGLARSTQLALHACSRAQHSLSTGSLSTDPTEGAPTAWCGWIDATRTLHAPGVAQQGVDLAHLLVVQPPPEDIARAAVRLTGSGLFAMVVVDRCGVPGASLSPSSVGTPRSTFRSTSMGGAIRWATAVRRLALAAESHETTILLLSGLEQARRDALPTAMRIELTRPHVDKLSLRIVKERRGRIPPPCTISLSELRLPQDETRLFHRGDEQGDRETRRSEADISDGKRWAS